MAINGLKAAICDARLESGGSSLPAAYRYLASVAEGKYSKLQSILLSGEELDKQYSWEPVPSAEEVREDQLIVKLTATLNHLRTRK